MAAVQWSAIHTAVMLNPSLSIRSCATQVPADLVVGGWAKFCFVQPPGIGVLGLCSLRAAQGKLALAMRAPCSPAAGSPTPVEGHVDIFACIFASLGQFARYTHTQ
eukprot:TRINITY_DN314_c0_g1_i1.p1 TRINITY_DN314_c0_g1~~TRINITY_DN314_c0_g1_i1.p1  ORF type:complete len:106 (-),score=8.80 TRINITY_DN314_c0_g1_i1:400-717(-)